MPLPVDSCMTKGGDGEGNSRWLAQGVGGTQPKQIGVSQEDSTQAHGGQPHGQQQQDPRLEAVEAALLLLLLVDGVHALLEVRARNLGVAALLALLLDLVQAPAV